MHRAALALILLSALTLPAAAQRGRGPRAGARSEMLPAANSEAERRILAVIEKARQADAYLNVPTADGRLLRLLTETQAPKTSVELGTSPASRPVARDGPPKERGKLTTSSTTPEPAPAPPIPETG